MKFIQALSLLQEKDKYAPRVLGMFQAKNPTNIIVWDKQTYQFRTFYTHKVQIITRDQLFSDDWDVVYILENDFTDDPEKESGS